VKIVVVHNTYQHAGGEDVVVELEQRILESAGHEVVAYRRSNVEIDQFSSTERVLLVKRLIWASDTYRDFTRLLDDEKPDLVHIHNTFLVISPSVYAACRRVRVPVVQTLHNFRLFCANAEFARDGKACKECLERTPWHAVRYGCYRSKASTAAVAAMLTWHRARGTLNDSVSAYIALTEFSRSLFVAGGLPEDRITVKPNFVDPDPGAGGPDRSGAIFVGRLWPTKGISTLVAALGRLQGAVPFAIIGDGPNRPIYEAEAERCGVPVAVFQGRLPRHEAIAAMQSARFLVFPSEWYENFPMTIAESFACGTPVLCSRLGAMREIVADGVTGLHFNPGDPDDLATKIRWAWAHPDTMRKMGANARREYEHKYTAARNYPKLAAIYAAAIRR
jgi:glycosyltransferase involved in cell wall biosynthesis